MPSSTSFALPGAAGVGHGTFVRRPTSAAGYVRERGYFDGKDWVEGFWRPGWFDGQHWVEGYWVSQREYEQTDPDEWEPEPGWDAREPEGFVPPHDDELPPALPITGPGTDADAGADGGL